MEAPINMKRIVMQLSHKIIPLMTQEELLIISMALEKTFERLEKEGRVVEE